MDVFEARAASSQQKDRRANMQFFLATGPCSIPCVKPSGARASGRADAFSTAVTQVVGETDIFTLQFLEEVTGFAVLTTRWATMVASPDVPEAFATRAWPAYVKCVQLPRYYLYVEEIVLVSAMARVNVAVFSQTGPLLRYKAGFFDGDGPIVSIKLRKNNNQGRVRSHFERLISAD
jgi:hypothetical protein